MSDRKPAAMTPQVRAALDAMTQIYRDVTAALDAVTDRQAVFDQASHLAAGVRDLADAASVFRAKVVHGIYVAEELTLVALANQLGISKSRAGQLKFVAEKAAAPAPQEDEQ